MKQNIELLNMCVETESLFEENCTIGVENHVAGYLTEEEKIEVAEYLTEVATILLLGLNRKIEILESEE